MSSYVYMKVLESTPERYDRGIRLLSRGAIDSVYDRLAELVAAPGRRVLDVGTGTGGVARACARRGACVVAIDIEPRMLEVARARETERPDDTGTALSRRDPAHRGGKTERGDRSRGDAPGGRIEWVEAGALEIEDHFDAASFDGATACLVFSELAPGEQDYVLETLRTRVRPGGIVAIADEVAPRGRMARAWWALRRTPFVALTWLLTQTTTRPVAGLADRMRSAGFEDVAEERMAGDFVLVYGRVPRGERAATGRVTQHSGGRDASDARPRSGRDEGSQRRLREEKS